jgi:hypothetical protein
LKTNRVALRPRPRPVVALLVGLVVVLVAAASAPAAVQTFGTTAPGGAWGCPGANAKYGNKYTLGENGTVTKITAYMQGNATTTGSQRFRTMIYAADAAGGGPGTLLATSQEAIVAATAAPGPVDFPFASAVSLTAGDYWLAQQSGASGQRACLSGTATAESDFNTDTYTDGPSNPFSASGTVKTEVNQWTLYATYETVDVTPPDTTPPTITGSRAPVANANGWNNTDVTVSFDCTDNVDGSGVDSVTGPTTLTSEGADQSVTGTCTDNEGNSASATVSGINIDKSAPSISGSPAPAPNGNGWNNSDVTVSFDCTDEGGSGADSVTDATTLTSEGAGQSVTGTCTDKAGNSASATVDGIKIDKTNPSISAGSPSPAPNANGWNKTDVTVTFDCTDEAGGSGVEAPTNVQTLSSEGGGQSAAGTCTDLAGNSASASVGGINIDKSDPSVSGSPAPLANATGWNKTDVTVSFDCTDAGSGVASVTDPTTLNSDGAGQSATGTCTDKAGNSSSATVNGINIDKTAPSISAGSPSPAANANGWNNTDVTVGFGCTDAGGSGLEAATDTKTLSSEGAGQSATGTCTDKAGNSASATVSGIKIDKTRPSISTGSQSPAANANGWNKTNVTVTFNCSDPGGSGTQAATDVRTLSSEGAGQSATGTCTDKAGNSASATVSGIKIDKTAPAIGYTGNAGTYALDASVNIVCSASDGLSGLAGSTCANVTGVAYTLGAGPHTVSATATDKAGNSASASATFTVKVTAGGLCNLTRQFVQGSAAYLALTPKQKAIADAAWRAVCQAAAVVPPNLTPAQKKVALRFFQAAVTSMRNAGFLTPAQAQKLVDLAAGL